MSEHVVVTRADGLLTLRINRPEKKNALTRAMYSRLAGSGQASTGSENKKPRHSHGGAFVFQRSFNQTIGSPTCRIFMPLVPPVVW